MRVNEATTANVTLDNDREYEAVKVLLKHVQNCDEVRNELLQ